MGLLGIIFGGNKRVVIGGKDTGLGGVLSGLTGVLRQTIGGVAGIVVDATVSEEHLTTCDLTENPVEDGAKVTDHVQLKPAQLTIEGVISDSPLGYAYIGNIQNLVRSVATLFGKSARSVDAYNDLLNLQKSRQPFTVTTGLKRYKNMIMTELSVPRTAQTGAAIHFRAVMREIRIVKSKTTGGGGLASGVSSLGSPTKDLGQKVTDAVPVGSQLSESSTSVTSGSQGSFLNEWFGTIRR